MKRPKPTTLATIAVAIGLAGAGNVTAYEFETIADGLDFPWSMAFLPNDLIVVAERTGALRIVRSGRLDPAPVPGVPDVYVAGQGGLMDVVPHPDFEVNRRLYLSYASGPPEANTTRVAYGSFDGGALRELTVIFDTAPTKDTPVHYGGRLAFLPDGTLLVTTGDGFDFREKAQRLDGLLGKVVRLDADGGIPPDNPFVGSDAARAEIFTYGHRNSQGLVIDADNDRIWLHEHGPRGGDELNLLEPGRNYGWPVIGFGLDYSGARISPYTEWPGMEQPVVYWVPSIAPAGMTLYDGELFPGWRGDLFVAALIERSVRRLDLDGTRVVDQQVLFRELDERIREVRTGPDGRLYLLTDSESGRLIAVSP